MTVFLRLKTFYYADILSRYGVYILEQYVGLQQRSLIYILPLCGVLYVYNIHYVQGVQHWIWKLLRGLRIGHVGSSAQINSLYVLVRPLFREDAV